MIAVIVDKSWGIHHVWLVQLEDGYLWVSMYLSSLLLKLSSTKRAMDTLSERAFHVGTTGDEKRWIVPEFLPLMCSCFDESIVDFLSGYLLWGDLVYLLDRVSLLDPLSENNPECRILCE